MSNTSAEQQARDLLERIGVPDAQEYASSDLVELANLINDLEAERERILNEFQFFKNEGAWLAKAIREMK